MGLRERERESEMIEEEGEGEGKRGIGGKRGFGEGGVVWCGRPSQRVCLLLLYYTLLLQRNQSIPPRTVFFVF